MFGTIRKHQTWLWAIIITLTIISFVIYFGPQSRINQGRGGAASTRGSINGDPITEEDFRDARQEVLLNYFLASGGSLPDEETARKSGFDIIQQTYMRLLLDRKLKEFGIHPSAEAVAKVARIMLRPPPKSNLSSPSAVMKQILEPKGFTMEDVERYIRHDLGIQELTSTVGLSGKLVTVDEAKGLYEREHQEVATAAIFASASNYLANVTANPETVATYYSNHVAEYRVPERVKVSYVEYPLTNFLAEANRDLEKITNVNERIDAVYQQRGTNYYRDAKSPEEAKEKIREEMRKELMTLAAHKKANAFATELFDKEPRQPQNLAALAKDKGLEVKVTAPFDRKNGPTEIKVGDNFAKAALALSPTDEPFAPPIIGEDAVYVIAFDQRIPSEVPPLDQIKDRVTADYKYDQARVLARQAGQTLYLSLTNGLAQGKTFSNLCAEANFKSTELPPFSLSTRTLPEAEDHISLNQLKQLAFGTPVGQVSNFQPTLEGGVILYVKAKLPLDQTKMNTELPAFVDYVRQTRQNEAFQDWFRKQMQRSMGDTPIFRPKEPSTAGNARAVKS